ncbi:MAG: hypothetical protein A3K19_19575 [Lentisphaerae bacterium RIFOXYB12_FULL_65_16]|nr:MAG: hypothetical protein A3K18_31240 [Lentisphaerae bacterium RIFOXYA12_64_32]OGV92063.1 MAG: hypothetical protein A3K19_19575 [Lentisphaerae bacterium RIFOXYB12_FULL_65_16]
MRVSDVSTQNLLLSIMQDNRAALARSQAAISSGRQYQMRSDAPTEAALASHLQAYADRDEQWQKNVDTALTWCQVTETRVSQSVEQLQQAHELVVQARDGTYSDTDRTLLVGQVDAILESLVQTANTTYDGKYLFGGTNSASAPVSVTRDAAGKITAVTYANTAPELRTAQTSAQNTMTYGATVVGNGTGLFVNNPDTPEATDIFASLIALRTTLEGAATPNDTQLDEMQQGLNTTIARLVDSGVQQTRLQAIRTRMLEAAPAEQLRISQLQDTDFAKVATELSLMQATLTASMKVIGRGAGMNLADYI